MDMGKWLLKETWEEEKQVLEVSIGHSGLWVVKRRILIRWISANCRL
jgi:hypothetical protein